MRTIKKQAAPSELKEYISVNEKLAPQNLTYENFPDKDKIKEALLKEQGYLCAYTMCRLNSIGECHVEHIEAQNTHKYKDLEYKNMAACFPSNGGDTSFGFGAPIKGGKHIVLNGNFVSPHSPNCEKRFQFDAKGKVSASDSDDATKQTINILQLNANRLIDLRIAAIMAKGLAPARGTRKRSELLSAKQARQFAQDVLKPINGKLEPFCVALSQVALSYAEREEKRGNRMKSQN